MASDRYLEKQSNVTVKGWLKSGEPMIWINAAAVAVSVIAVVGLLIILAVNGLRHFWPASIVSADYTNPQTGEVVRILGERVDDEDVSLDQLKGAGLKLDTEEQFLVRYLLKRGNRDVTGADFGWYLDMQTGEVSYPKAAIAMERREWGNFYGFLKEVKEDGKVVATAGGENQEQDPAWDEFQKRLTRALSIHHDIEEIEKGEISSVNYAIEKLRLRQRGLELDDDLSEQQKQLGIAEINAERDEQNRIYEKLQENLESLYKDIKRDSVVMTTAQGVEVNVSLAHIVRAYRPNAMSIGDKISEYFSKLWEFLTADPREANTEGGIFPAIFGTVMMVLLMSVLVTPFGVVAAVYLREYAKQGTVTRMIRIAVNNLAGVPSIVYGVFGLGFFIYFIGGAVDEALFPESLPAPTFGTPGLMWASLTLALLTLPVVIVATEEGLARIPRSVREGSLALGATKAETLWRVVLPMASPAMMTGLILAVARAAGEVAPLMLVGVVKLAPSLPLDGNFPFVHLERKFMHLGFHIYDVGFQSPNVEAARPLVYATALLLVVVIALLNFSAVSIRNRLREKYKALEH